MTKRTSIFITAILALGLLAAVPAMARNHGGPGHGSGYGHGGPGYGHAQGYGCGGPGSMRGGPGYGGPALTTEQQKTFDQIIDKHQEKLFQLRQDIWAKRTQLDALTRSGQADPGKVEQLTTEISDLRGQLFQERQAMRRELNQKLGDVAANNSYGRGYHRGPHHGMMGHGMGYGPCMTW
ncbi:periplasmic heavy metal sensor [Desulfohalovibrio reitneri]|uniref:periplasmic heavy metal sensor n=1 Tax=Desulfohalovibrio reitneri TaxID=1307759 RepID=UPI000689E73F|nr:periplasmic heavy metal sensor [Desulfohalovibrio reitneri]